MNTLVINDLPIGKELDREAMANIIGGHGGRRKKGHHGRRGGYYKRVDQSVDIDIFIVGNNNTVNVDVDQDA